MKKKCVIFDVDGTLADNKHRHQWIVSQPKNWDAWYAGVKDDKLILPVASRFIDIKTHHKDIDIIVLSGRSDQCRQSTEDWLKAHLPMDGVPIYMRKANDHRQDYIIKHEIAQEIMKTYDILEAYDDRKQVIDMWISLGVFVFDVSQGKGNF